MYEIYFFTTSRHKLANFRHLARQWNIRVLSFREKTYAAPYTEPKLSDRRQLLEESYRSALKLWNKHFENDKEKIFFLEDTSVVIDALSAPDQEMPGVDVKYWMEGMTFEVLDQSLRRVKNNRRVTVRSDIVVHIPDKVRSALNIAEEFLWLTGESRGTIIDREVPVDNSLLYPWLNNRTFNRWFVPNGQARPISCLPIADADVSDFRRAAFEKLIVKLSPLLNKPLFDPRNTPQQLSLPGWGLPSVLIIVGYSCAGKSTLARHLVDTFGYVHLEASDYMRKEFIERHGLAEDISIADFAQQALLYEPWVAAEPISKEILFDEYPFIVVTGLRSPEELKVIQAYIGASRTVELIFIDASSENRFKRSVARAREDVSKKSFNNRDLQEKAMGQERFLSLPGCHMLKNNFQTLEPFFRAVERSVGDVDSNLLLQPLSATDSALRPLERLILKSLTYSSVALTTTEIAKQIKVQFDEEKSKNNVSRYFNQAFSAYFRVKQDGLRYKYKLSATGYSVAKRIEWEDIRVAYTQKMAR